MLGKSPINADSAARLSIGILRFMLPQGSVNKLFKRNDLCAFISFLPQLGGQF
jgi:hypothetical protein